MTSPSAAEHLNEPPGAPRAGRRTPPPWLFLLLYMPLGMLTGAITGALLSFLLRREGHAMYGIANELALLGIPPILYFGALSRISGSAGKNGTCSPHASVDSNSSGVPSPRSFEPPGGRAAFCRNVRHPIELGLRRWHGCRPGS